MIIIAQSLLTAQFLFFAFAAVFSIAAVRVRPDAGAIAAAWARNAVSFAALLGIAILALAAWAFLTNDFSIEMVAKHSSLELGAGYKISAIWASAQGSFLVWAVLQYCLFAVWTAGFTGRNFDLEANCTALGSVICACFAAILLIIVKPFGAAGMTIEQGAGLNPLLQNMWMIVHPPILFAGYSAMLMPFAVALAGVFTGQVLEEQLYARMRRWLLLGLFFLTIGIGTGAKWAYIELGWGGFWAWDPVENASLLPWLIGVAALHSIVITMRTGKCGVMSIALGGLGFIFCIAATFITRSGILQSVHAFGGGAIGSALLMLIGFLSGLWIATVVRARVLLQDGDEGQFEILSRYSALFITCMVFVFAAVVILAGTLWPVISRTFGEPVTPSRAFYDKISGVIAIVLSILLGIATASSWRKLDYRKTAVGAGAGGVTIIAGCFAMSPLNAVMQGVCVFALAMVSWDLVKGKDWWKKAGLFVSHVGLIVMISSIGISGEFERSTKLELAKGESKEFCKYLFTYEEFEHVERQAEFQAGPMIKVAQGQWSRRLWPHNRISGENRSTAEIAVSSGVFRDIYLVFDGLNEQKQAQLSVLIKPMMNWLWAGMAMMATGTIIAIFTRERSR